MTAIRMRTRGCARRERHASDGGARDFCLWYQFVTEAIRLSASGPAVAIMPVPNGSHVSPVSPPRAGKPEAGAGRLFLLQQNNQNNPQLPSAS